MDITFHHQKYVTVNLLPDHFTRNTTAVMLSCGTFLLGICLCLVHHGLQWRTCVVTALPVEILEVGQELIAATPIDPFPSDLTEAIHSLSHCSSRPNAPLPFVLYVLFDAQCSSECLRTLSAAWGQECMPAPTAVYVVNAMRYSTPLTDVGQFKTHAAALTHFLLILQEDSFSDPTVMMVVDLTEHCLSLASLSARSTLTDTLALALFPTVTPLYFASLSSSYITTGPFIKHTLLEHVLIGSTLLEYTLPDTDTTVNALRSHLLSLNPPTTRAALTSEYQVNPCLPHHPLTRASQKAVHCHHPVACLLHCRHCLVTGHTRLYFLFPWGISTPEA